jgi:glycosyltransferase involved in cell wall biosynthesis
MKINLSIIIPVYQAQHTINRTLRSINNQLISDEKLNIEIILNY